MITVSSADFWPLALDLALLIGTLTLFVLDLFVDARSGRTLGIGAAALVGGLLIASFFVDTSGAAFSGAYVGDDWSLILKRIFLGAGLLGILGSLDHAAEHYSHRQGEYYMMILFSVLGMTLLPGARDLILLIVCFELMGIPLFVLAAWAKNDEQRGSERDAPEAALKLYLVGVVSTAITLFGFSLLYGLSGTTRIAELGQMALSPLAMVAGLFVLAGMGFKIGAVPFHFWVPDTYQGSGTPFVSFLSVAPKIAGFAALSRVFLLDAGPTRQITLVAMAVASIVLGNLLAVVQTDVKRLLAFSGVGHIGFMLLAFALGDVMGTAMLVFYATAYVVTNVGAFLVVEVIERDQGPATIASFNGLSRRSPTLALAMLLFLLSLAGIPFVVGFWAKLYVFVAAWRGGLHAVVLIGAVASVVGLFYYLQIARAMYMMPVERADRLRSGGAVNLAVALCLAGVVAFGLWPAPLLDGASLAATAFQKSSNTVVSPAND